MGILRVGARRATTTAEGPGMRYALWLQGCSIRCLGCCNPHLFDPTRGASIEVSVLLREVANAGPDIEGVSVLGGEPFDQAPGLAPFVRGVRALGLGVIVFTGFTREELEGSGDSAVAQVLAATDLLVDGRFERARPEERRPWVGSANQRFHYLTPRYTAAIEEGPEGRPTDRIEIEIDAEGRVHRNGWPLASDRDDFSR